MSVSAKSFISGIASSRRHPSLALALVRARHSTAHTPCSYDAPLLTRSPPLFLYQQPNDTTAALPANDNEVQDLEQRIQALEVGAKYDATKAAVQAVENEYLLKLREIRAAVTAEAASGGSGASSKEVEALRAENEMLQKKNAKLDYRVLHLVLELEALYDKHKALAKKS